MGSTLTAIVLTSLFAEFLRSEIVRDRIGNKTALVITLAIGYVVSTLDFAGIARFLGPILEVVYPALIALTVFNIVSRYLLKINKRGELSLSTKQEVE